MAYRKTNKTTHIGMIEVRAMVPEGIVSAFDKSASKMSMTRTDYLRHMMVKDNENNSKK